MQAFPPDDLLQHHLQISIVRPDHLSGPGEFDKGRTHDIVIFEPVRNLEQIVRGQQIVPVQHDESLPRRML